MPNDQSFQQSLKDFYAAAIDIRLSSTNHQEQIQQLKACAQQHFYHRHWSSWMRAEVVKLINSLFRAIGSIFCQVDKNHMFFTPKQTQRELDFVAGINENAVEESAAVFKSTMTQTV